MYSNGRRKSFWKRKFANSPFSRNFIDSCRRESTAKNAMSSFGLHPTYSDISCKWCNTYTHPTTVHNIHNIKTKWLINNLYKTTTVSYGYISHNKKKIISEKFFPANVLAWYYRNSTQQKQTTWCRNKVIKANMEKHLTAKHNGITHNWLCETDYRNCH